MSVSGSCDIRVQPLGLTIEAARGSPLRDALFEQGVEFPCGGNGRCRGCRVRVLDGAAELNPAQAELLSRKEIEDGWRLACQCSVEGDLLIEVRQWDASILLDDSTFEFIPREGFGIAVDVGTTTLVAQLVDLQKGCVLAVKSVLNPQSRFGADVMSRVQHAVASGARSELTQSIRREVGRLIRMLLSTAEMDSARVVRVVLVGNTAMHHLFCAVDVTPLAYYPFNPVNDGLQRLSASDLDWPIPDSTEIMFLGCLGGFVGCDLLAGILATRIHERDETCCLIDLGTNGEIVIGNKHGILCASTAAGPAFEGARISCGMRAATGAIWKVSRMNGHLRCESLGGAPARGICGSGLVDAVSVGLETERILPSGRLASGNDLPLEDSVSLTQKDIRQLQLAKGAIAAGVRILLREMQLEQEQIDRVYLAGAFGNYVDRESARRIGLLSFAPDKIQAAGNAALLGAKMALFLPDPDSTCLSIRRLVRHVSLNDSPCFQDVYVEEMAFPTRGVAV